MLEDTAAEKKELLPRHAEAKVTANSMYIFFISSLSCHLELPQSFRISLLIFILSFVPKLSISFLHESSHLVFCLPRRLFPGTGASTILVTCTYSFLLTCPHHFSLLSVIVFATGASITDPLMFVSDSIFLRDSTNPQLTDNFHQSLN